MAKTGKLSKDDERYILANAGRMKAETIAKNLNRTPAGIVAFIKKNYKPKGDEETEEVESFIIKQELRNSETWKVLETEFTKDELKLFEEQYIQLMTQFSGDKVLPTEETQIMQVVKIDILMHRNLAARQRSLQDISRLERAQDEFLSKYPDASSMTQMERDFSLALENQLQAARNAEQFRTTEWAKLHERHTKLLENLKGTREQRIKEITDGKQSVLQLFKMLQNKDIQENIGREAELMKLSAEKEYERLGKVHKYEDGALDRPILSVDTVDLDEDMPTENKDGSE